MDDVSRPPGDGHNNPTLDNVNADEHANEDGEMSSATSTVPTTPARSGSAAPSVHTKSVKRKQEHHSTDPDTEEGPQKLRPPTLSPDSTPTTESGKESQRMDCQAGNATDIPETNTAHQATGGTTTTTTTPPPDSSSTTEGSQAPCRRHPIYDFVFESAPLAQFHPILAHFFGEFDAVLGEAMDMTTLREVQATLQHLRKGAQESAAHCTATNGRGTSTAEATPPPSSNLHERSKHAQNKQTETPDHNTGKDKSQSEKWSDVAARSGSNTSHSRTNGAGARVRQDRKGQKRTEGSRCGTTDNSTQNSETTNDSTQNSKTTASTSGFTTSTNSNERKSQQSRRGGKPKSGQNRQKRSDPGFHPGSTPTSDTGTRKPDKMDGKRTRNNRHRNSRRLFVSGLSQKDSVVTLTRTFSGLGEVTECSVKRGQRGMFAFVTLSSVLDAQDCVRKFAKRESGLPQWTVVKARPPPQRDPSCAVVLTGAPTHSSWQDLKDAVRRGSPTARNVRRFHVHAGEGGRVIVQMPTLNMAQWVAKELRGKSIPIRGRTWTIHAHNPPQQAHQDDTSRTDV